MYQDILSAPFVKEMCDTTANLYRLGWDERNGGNISYLLNEEEVQTYLDINKVSLRVCSKSILFLKILNYLIYYNL